jgi:GrpB-like predicted nucleotidyltransferase (UPF0157 family)
VGQSFNTESIAIQNALGKNAVAIHHIGSTSIPSIVAMPIIDVLIAVSDIKTVDEGNSAKSSLVYEAMGEFGMPGRRNFRKEDRSGRRTHYVHSFAADSDRIQRHLAFRDFMIAHPEHAHQYSKLKFPLVERFPVSIESDMDGKDDFVQEIDRLAATWKVESE